MLLNHLSYRLLLQSALERGGLVQTGHHWGIRVKWVIEVQTFVTVLELICTSIGLDNFNRDVLCIVCLY